MNKKVKVEILDHDDPQCYGDPGPKFQQESFGNDFHSERSVSGWQPSSFLFFLPGCAGMFCLALMLILAGAAVFILLPVFILLCVLRSFFRLRGFSSPGSSTFGGFGKAGNSEEPPLFIQVFHSESWKK